VSFAPANSTATLPLATFGDSARVGIWAWRHVSPGHTAPALSCSASAAAFGLPVLQDMHFCKREAPATAPPLRGARPITPDNPIVTARFMSP